MRKLITLCSLSLVLFSCTPKKKDVVITVTPTVQNVSGTYILGKITVTGGSTPGEQDVTNTVLQPCQKDDEQKLNSSMVYDYVDAGTTCSSNGSHSSSWSLPSTTTIMIDGSTWDIIEFNGTKLTIGHTTNGSTYCEYLTKK